MGKYLRPIGVDETPNPTLTKYADVAQNSAESAANDANYVRDAVNGVRSDINTLNSTATAAKTALDTANNNASSIVLAATTAKNNAEASATLAAAAKNSTQTLHDSVVAMAADVTSKQAVTTNETLTAIAASQAAVAAKTAAETAYANVANAVDTLEEIVTEEFLEEIEDVADTLDTVTALTTTATTAATNASNSATAAATSATNAATSATNASTSATAAATSETNAALSSAAAAVSATSADTSADEAAASATSAASAQELAEAAQAAAEEAQSLAEQSESAASDHSAACADYAEEAEASAAAAAQSATEAAANAAAVNPTQLNTRLTTIESNITTNTTAISGKVDKVTGKGLSTNDFTTAEKTNLATALTEIDELQEAVETLQNTPSAAGSVVSYPNYTEVADRDALEEACMEESNIEVGNSVFAIMCYENPAQLNIQLVSGSWSDLTIRCRKDKLKFSNPIINSYPETALDEFIYTASTYTEDNVEYVMYNFPKTNQEMLDYLGIDTFTGNFDVSVLLNINYQTWDRVQDGWFSIGQGEVTTKYVMSNDSTADGVKIAQHDVALSRTEINDDNEDTGEATLVVPGITKNTKSVSLKADFDAPAFLRFKGKHRVRVWINLPIYDNLSDPSEVDTVKRVVPGFGYQFMGANIAPDSRLQYGDVITYNNPYGTNVLGYGYSSRWNASDVTSNNIPYPNQFSIHSPFKNTFVNNGHEYNKPHARTNKNRMGISSQIPFGKPSSSYMPFTPALPHSTTGTSDPNYFLNSLAYCDYNATNGSHKHPMARLHTGWASYCVFPFAWRKDVNTCYDSNGSNNSIASFIPFVKTLVPAVPDLTGDDLEAIDKAEAYGAANNKFIQANESVSSWMYCDAELTRQYNTTAYNQNLYLQSYRRGTTQNISNMGMSVELRNVVYNPTGAANGRKSFGDTGTSYSVQYPSTSASDSSKWMRQKVNYCAGISFYTSRGQSATNTRFGGLECYNGDLIVSCLQHPLAMKYADLDSECTANRYRHSNPILAKYEFTGYHKSNISNWFDVKDTLSMYVDAAANPLSRNKSNCFVLGIRYWDAEYEGWRCFSPGDNCSYDYEGGHWNYKKYLWVDLDHPVTYIVGGSKYTEDVTATETSNSWSNDYGFSVYSKQNWFPNNSSYKPNGVATNNTTGTYGKYNNAVIHVETPHFDNYTGYKYYKGLTMMQVDYSSSPYGENDTLYCADSAYGCFNNTYDSDVATDGTDAFDNFSVSEASLCIKPNGLTNATDGNGDLQYYNLQSGNFKWNPLLTAATEYNLVETGYGASSRNDGYSFHAGWNINFEPDVYGYSHNTLSSDGTNAQLSAFDTLQYVYNNKYTYGGKLAENGFNSVRGIISGRYHSTPSNEYANSNTSGSSPSSTSSYYTSAPSSQLYDQYDGHTSYHIRIARLGGN